MCDTDWLFINSYDDDDKQRLNRIFFFLFCFFFFFKFHNGNVIDRKSYLDTVLNKKNDFDVIVLYFGQNLRKMFLWDQGFYSIKMALHYILNDKIL